MPKFWDWIGRVADISAVWLLLAGPTAVTAIVAFVEAVPWTVKIPMILLAFACSISIWLQWPQIKQRLGMLLEPSHRKTLSFGSPAFAGMFSEAVDPEFQKLHPAEADKPFFLTKPLYSSRDRDRIANALSDVSDLVRKHGGEMAAACENAWLSVQRGNDTQLKQDKINFEIPYKIIGDNLFGEKSIINNFEAHREDIEVTIDKNAVIQSLGNLYNAFDKFYCAFSVAQKTDHLLTISERNDLRRANTLFLDNLRKEMMALRDWQKAYEIRRQSALAFLAKQQR